jgi:hypothetical protein
MIVVQTLARRRGLVPMDMIETFPCRVTHHCKGKFLENLGLHEQPLILDQTFESRVNPPLPLLLKIGNKTVHHQRFRKD